MISGTNAIKRIAATTFSVMVALSMMMPVDAKILKGGVSEEGLRLAPSSVGRGLSGQADNTMRIQRAPSALKGSAVDATAFAAPLTPRTSPLEGVVDTNQFAKAPKFDIGADRGSKEMVLAWERWHKQLSQAIYQRWQAMAQDPGHATVRIFVTKDRTIRAQVLRSTGAPQFDGVVLAAIDSLNGNPGLTFPAQSQRQNVSFEADYIAGANVQPGYSWVKNDYEKVRQDY